MRSVGGVEDVASEAEEEEVTFQVRPPEGQDLFHWMQWQWIGI